MRNNYFGNNFAMPKGSEQSLYKNLKSRFPLYNLVEDEIFTRKLADVDYDKNIL